MLTLLALALLGTPTVAGAFGLGYAYELHQFEHRRIEGQPNVKVQLPVHRVKIIDSTGLLASIIASTRYDRKVVTKRYSTTTTETFWSEYTPMPQGMRVQLVHAWSGADVDTQRTGGPVEEVTAAYSEWRFAVGGQFADENLYIDFDFIDMVWRDLTGPTRIDRFMWNFNLEAGVYADRVRVGLRGEADLFSAVDSIFDGLPWGNAWGVASYYDMPLGSLSLVWRSYSRVADDLGSLVVGRSITLGGHFEF